MSCREKDETSSNCIGVLHWILEVLKWTRNTTRMSVRHCVLLKLKDGTTKEQIGSIVHEIRRLKELVPDIVALRCGVQVEEADDGRNATVSAVVDFPNEAAYQVYAKHEEHVRVITELILPHLSAGGRSAIQFEMGKGEVANGLEGLLVHVVLLKLNDDTKSTSVKEMVMNIKNLGTKARPLVKSIYCGRQIENIDDGRNSTVGAVVVFRSEEDYSKYARHPKHVAVQKITSHLTWRRRGGRLFNFCVCQAGRGGSRQCQHQSGTSCG